MPDTISFARGAPSADILPHEQVREALHHADIRTEVREERYAAA